MENIKVKRKTDQLEKRINNFILNNETKKAVLLINDPKCSVNWTGLSTNWTFLMKSSFRGHPSVVKALLKRPDLLINYQCWSDDSALTWAAVKKKTRCVELLVNDSRTNINLMDGVGRSALWWAYSENYTAIMKLLISHGANVNGVAVSVVKYNVNRGSAPLTTEATMMMKNWKTYLPEVTRFAKTNMYYPVEFKRWAFNFILCCTKSQAFCKDTIYLLLKYIARAWKRN